MKVCIIGAGAGGRSASGRIRELDKQAQIDIFTTQSEIGYAPCEPPFVLREVASWEDIFYPGKFFEERNITVHLNTEVTDILRKEKRIIAGDKSYSYDKLILSPGAVPSIPPIPDWMVTMNLLSAPILPMGEPWRKLFPNTPVLPLSEQGQSGWK